MTTTTRPTDAELEVAADIVARLRRSAKHEEHKPHPDAEPLESLKAIKVIADPMPATADRPGIAEYFRISDDREGAGLGVKRQKVDVDPMVAELDCYRPGDVVHVYVDNDLTASGKVKRPAYEQLLADMAAGKVKALLAWHPDRLYRRTADLDPLITLVGLFKHVIIRTARHGDLDLATATGRLVARILADIGLYELEHLSERVMAKMVENAKAGKPGGGPRLFGYTAGMRPDPETGTCIVEPEAEAVRTVVSQILAGASLRSQGLWLAEQGYLQRDGKPWDGTRLKRYLLRPALAGIRVHRHGQEDEARYTAEWPALITEDQHMNLELLLTDPARKLTKVRTRKHLLTGIARCGRCGGVVEAARENGGKFQGVPRPRYASYRCRERQDMTREQTRVDGVIVELVGDWLAKQEPSGLLVDPETDATARHLSAQIRELQRKLSRVEQDYDSEALTGAEYRARKDKLSAELGEAERARLALQRPVSVLDGLWGQVDAAALFEALPLSRQRAVIQAIGIPLVLPGNRWDEDSKVADIAWHDRVRV